MCKIIRAAIIYLTAHATNDFKIINDWKQLEAKREGEMPT